MHTECYLPCRFLFYSLSVDNLTILILVRCHILSILVHGAEAHTHR